MAVLESVFEKELEDIAKALNCLYIKIPDAIPFKERRERSSWAARRRPFDGILSTPSANIALELKINYTPLADHQKEYLYSIRTLNGLAFCLRMIDSTKKTKYRLDAVIRNGLEFDKEVILESENLLDIFQFLKEIGGN